jgi:xanthine dehydrogenase molybdopterin binding subunit/xanthine dehydrogenase small subunit
MFAGREIVTVEGLARGPELHPVQSAMVDNYGSQCGYCTPGFVVSMFEAYYRTDCREPWKINDQLCGNLCRCTGYRPIRDAAASVLAHEPAPDRFTERLRAPISPPCAFGYTEGSESFFRPGSLAELFDLKRAHPEAKLVAGATEIGVELNKKFRRFPVLISVEAVPDLCRIVSSPSEWRIGSAATLTAIEDALAGEYPSLAKMLSGFAGRQIRNRATMGGNLATASPIGDCAPVLLAFDASVVLVSAGAKRSVPLAGFFTGYRKTVMRPDEIILEIVLPRAAGPGLNRREDFMKVSHRRELDISIVSAAFCIDCDSAGVVRRARLAYGGVAETPRRVIRVETVLVGKRLSDGAAAAIALLLEEFAPIDDARGSAAYRNGLVVSLFEKFVAGETSLACDAKPVFSPGARWEGDDPARSLRHESAVGHVTGSAKYVDDTAHERPMLDVWPVCSPHARAKILRRDATRARNAPGIVAVLMGEDIPGMNNVGVARHDETLFAVEEACYDGHIVALVVGETLADCQSAASLVEIDYEPLQPILSIASAIAQNSFHTESHVIRRGDCEGALKRAPERLTGEFSSGGQEHFYLETQAAWAEVGDGGDIFISSSTQHPSDIQATVAEVMGMPRNRIVVQAPRMGGAFGGKETQGNTPAALVALAAVKTGKPVRVQFDRDIDMRMTGKRHPFHSKYEVGYDLDGRLLAADIQLVSSGGWSLDLSQAVMDRALFHLDNAYYIPAVCFSGRVAKTNVASNTAFRGFGGPQAMLVIEEVMDRVARELGLPPEVVRERNLYHGTGEMNTTHYKEDIGDSRLEVMWRTALEQSRFSERRATVAAWNGSHARVKRGLAITPVKFGISFTAAHFNQAGALVLIYQDGTVQVNHGGTEMGQGLHTKILGVAMRELGLPADRIRLMATATDKVPNTSATAASSSSDLNGAAVREACRTLRERLAPIAAGLLARDLGRQPAPEEIDFAQGAAIVRDSGTRVAFAEVCKQAYLERVSLSATGFYRTPNIHWDWKTSTGHPFHYFACGVGVSEVEVDGYTGMCRVIRVDLVENVGESMNPGIDRGQIEGGFIQGMGWLTSEELKWDGNGRLLTHSASTYQIPAISDAPLEFNVTLLPNAAQDSTIYGSKAAGEPPLMLAISVREAIRDAIAACGKPGGEVQLSAPATPEAVFASVIARLQRSIDLGHNETLARSATVVKA